MKPSKKPDPYALDSGDAARSADTAAARPGAAQPGAAQPGAAQPGAAQPAAAATSERFTAALRGNVHVITLSKGNVLDGFEIDSLGKELQSYVQSAGTPDLVIDLVNVHHLSSAALGMLITLKSAAEGHGGGIRLANVRDELKKIFKLTKLNKVLKIHKDVDSAAKSF